MCRWYCLFSNCCRASHRPCINRRSSADKSRVKPISAFALISWGSSRSHSCVADHEPHAPPHSTSVLTTCVNRMHRHHDSPMISRVPRSHYCFFPKTASIIGTFLVATTTSLTGNASFGVLSIAVLLVVALVFLLLQKDPTRANVLRHRR